MDREELVGIQTIWWVDYQLAVGFLTGSWKSNMDVWISNQLFGNPTACLSWPRCNGDWRAVIQINFFFQEQPSDYDHFSDGHPLGGGIIGGRDPLCWWPVPKVSITLFESWGNITFLDSLWTRSKLFPFWTKFNFGTCFPELWSNKLRIIWLVLSLLDQNFKDSFSEHIESSFRHARHTFG